MSLLRKERRDKIREAKAVAHKTAKETVVAAESAPSENAKSNEPKFQWLKRYWTARVAVYALNFAMLGWIGYAWAGRYYKEFREEEMAREVAYRVSRFTGEISYLEKLKNVHAEFMLPVGEAPYLMRGEMHLLWEQTPREDVAFMWQNDHFARQRGVVVVSTDRNLLQSVDAMLDDGDLGNGTAQMHPRGLWVSLK